MSDEQVKKEAGFVGWLKRAYAAFAAWFYKYAGGLFIEVKDGQKVISIGRVMLLVVFLTMLYFWVLKKVQEGFKLEMPDMLFETFCVLCGYVFSTKVTAALKLKWNDGNKASEGREK